MSNNLDVQINLKDNISNDLQKVVGNLNKLKTTVDSVNTNTQKIASKGGFMKQMIGANLVTSAVTTAIDGLKNLGFAVFEAYSNSETYLTKLTGMLGGNRQAAEEHAKELSKLAKQTPFDLKDLQSSDSLLMAYGYRVDEIVDKIKTFGDVAAGVAKPGEGPDLSGIIAVMGQIKGKGKADTRDLYQFAERGIDIFGELSKVTGKSIAEVQKMTEKGMIGEKEVMMAFQNMSSEGGKFYKAMENLSKTPMGRISNIGDTIYQGFAEVGKKMEPIFDKVLTLINNIVDKVSSGGLDGFIQGIIKVVSVIVDILAPVLNMIWPLIEQVGIVFNYAADIIKMVWDSLSVLLIPIFELLGEHFKKTGEIIKKVLTVNLFFLSKIIKVVAIVLEPVIAIFSGLIKLAGVIVEKIDSIGDAFIDMLNRVLRSLGMDEITREKRTVDLSKFQKGGPSFLNKNKVNANLPGVTNNTSTPKVDTMASQQPKIVNINVLSGSGASLIQHLEMQNIIDKSSGKLTDDFKREIEQYLLEILTQGSLNMI